MLARLLLGGALGMAVVTLSTSANAENDGNGSVSHTQSDRIGSHFNGDSSEFNGDRSERGKGFSLTFSQDKLDDADDDHDHGRHNEDDEDHGRHKHRSHHHNDD